MTRFATLVLLVGVLLGGAAAVALPRSAAPAGAPRLDVSAIVDAPRTQPGQLAIDIGPGGAPRIAVRAADPAGGPEWAVQKLSGEYRLPAGVPRDRVGKELLGPRVCLRLGRLVQGRFGWLDGNGTFRPASRSGSEIPTRCLRGGDQPTVQQTTWVSHPTFGPAVPLADVVWGPAAGPTTVRAARADLDVITAGGAFLAFAPATAQTPTLTVTSGGKDLSTDEFGPRGELPAATMLGAQAPDPEGSAPWGVSVGRLGDGRWCYGNAARVVDDHVGDIQPGLDTFFDQTSFAYQCGPPVAQQQRDPKFRVLTRRKPLSYGFSVGLRATTTTAARTALRTLPTTTVFAGVARPDVRTIRVVAPTQTRVLRPSGPAHAFVVPFNGEFPSGKISFEVTFTDGTVVHQGEDPSL